MTEATRQTDEMILRCLELRAAGHGPTEIAQKTGQNLQRISVAMKRVADDDIAHEPAAAAAYPWRTGPRKHGPSRRAA